MLAPGPAPVPGDGDGTRPVPPAVRVPVTEGGTDSPQWEEGRRNKGG